MGAYRVGGFFAAVLATASAAVYVVVSTRP